MKKIKNNITNKPENNRKKRKKFIITIATGSIIAATSTALIVTTLSHNNGGKISFQKRAKVNLLTALTAKPLVIKATTAGSGTDPYAATLTEIQKTGIFNKLINSIAARVELAPTTYGYPATPTGSTAVASADKFIKADVSSWIDKTTIKISAAAKDITRTIPGATKSTGKQADSKLFYKEYSLSFNLKGIVGDFTEKLFKYTSLDSSKTSLSQYAKDLLKNVTTELSGKIDTILNPEKVLSISPTPIKGLEDGIKQLLHSLDPTAQGISPSKGAAHISTLTSEQQKILSNLKSEFNKVLPSFQQSVETKMDSFTTLKLLDKFLPIKNTKTKLDVEFKFVPTEFAHALILNFPILQKTFTDDSTITVLDTYLKKMNQLFTSDASNEVMNLKFNQKAIKNITYQVTDFVGLSSPQQTLEFQDWKPNPKKPPIIKLYKTKLSIQKRIDKYYNAVVKEEHLFDSGLQGDIESQMITKSTTAMYKILDNIQKDDLVKRSYPLRPYLISFTLANGIVLKSKDSPVVRSSNLVLLQTYQKNIPDEIIKVKITNSTDVTFELLGTLGVKVVGIDEHNLTSTNISPTAATFKINTSVLELLDKYRPVYNVFSEKLAQYGVKNNAKLINRLVEVWNAFSTTDQIVAGDIVISTKTRIDGGDDSPIDYSIGIKKGNIWLMPLTTHIINLAP